MRCFFEVGSGKFMLCASSLSSTPSTTSASSTTTSASSTTITAVWTFFGFRWPCHWNNLVCKMEWQKEFLKIILYKFLLFDPLDSCYVSETLVKLNLDQKRITLYLRFNLTWIYIPQKLKLSPIITFPIIFHYLKVIRQ